MRIQVRIGRCAGAVAAAAAGFVVCQGQAGAQSLRVDDGVIRTPVPTSTYQASMPTNTGGAGSSLQLGRPGGGGNLGTFDIVINPTPALAGNAAALAAFNRAAERWEAFIADPITVNINADFSALGPGILGSTNSVILSAGYDTIRNPMVVDAADEPDDAVVAFLPTAAQFMGFLPSPQWQFAGMQASKANLKALGFDPANLDAIAGTTSDGNIVFSTGFTFDFDDSNGITAGTIDFEGVATHEIGHLLGFFSDVDYVDFVLSQGQFATDVRPNTLDLFRFDDDPANDPDSVLPGEGSFTTEPRSLVPGNVEHFDQINNLFGGDTEILMATGVSQGDGRQASHWKDNLGLGLMDPTLAFGELGLLRPNDLRAIDLIGYEIIVPEPGSVTLLAAAGALLATRRRRRAA